MKKEDGRSLGGGRPVTPLFRSDAQRYLTHLIHQFGGDVEGLAAQVFELMRNPQHKSAVERAVMELRSGAVLSHYIKSGNSNSLTWIAQVHLRSWYPHTQGGVPGYQGYARRELGYIVNRYKPKETK